MMRGSRVRSRLIGAEDSFAERMRRRRWDQILEVFPDFESLRVLDLGGTTLFWSRSPVRPKLVTVVNLLEPGEGSPWVVPVSSDVSCRSEGIASPTPSRSIRSSTRLLTSLCFVVG